MKPNICRVRLRSQTSESNGESSVTRWRPRRPAASSASAAGSAQPRVIPEGPSIAPLLADAALAAGLTPVAIEGPAGVSRGWADPAALAEEAAGRRGRHRVTLLSPFDSLIWDRKRTRQMFGFAHAIEAYVPKPKRVHGYYAMPLLAGGRLAGRADPARDGRTLVARQVSLDRASAAEPMAQALREAASWVGCDDVRLERVEPAPWAPRLAAALAELS